MADKGGTRRAIGAFVWSSEITPVRTDSELLGTSFLRPEVFSRLEPLAIGEMIPGIVALHQKVTTGDV